jgi:hypothetical protein
MYEYVFIYTYTKIFMYGRLHEYICMHEYMYICTDIFITYIHVYIHLQIYSLHVFTRREDLFSRLMLKKNKKETSYICIYLPKYKESTNENIHLFVRILILNFILHLSTVCDNSLYMKIKLMIIIIIIIIIMMYKQ